MKLAVLNYVRVCMSIAINSMSFCHLNEHVVDRIKMITNVNFMEMIRGEATGGKDRCAFSSLQTQQAVNKVSNVLADQTN